jgi:hypothetical protein
MGLGMSAPAAPDPRFAAVPVLFFGIGAQKCGTTWLHEYLRDHPQAKVPEVAKELHYWDAIRPPHIRPLGDLGGFGVRRAAARGFARARLDRAGRLALDRQATWEKALRGGDASHRAYADLLFDGHAGERAVGEITPAYALVGADTLGEMAALSPTARFFFVMRDPVARLLSGLRMKLSRAFGAVTPESLAAMADDTLSRDPELDLARSRYEETIAKLDAAVPAERAAYFFYETLFDQRELDRLCAFLGIAPRTADTGRRVFAGESETPVAAGLIARLRAALQATYDAVAERFGPLVPQAWAAGARV